MRNFFSARERTVIHGVLFNTIYYLIRQLFNSYFSISIFVYLYKIIYPFARLESFSLHTIETILMTFGFRFLDFWHENELSSFDYWHACYKPFTICIHVFFAFNRFLGQPGKLLISASFTFDNCKFRRTTFSCMRMNCFPYNIRPTFLINYLLNIYNSHTSVPCIHFFITWVAS